MHDNDPKWLHALNRRRPGHKAVPPTIAINSTRQFDGATCGIFSDSQRVCKYARGKETDE